MVFNDKLLGLVPMKSVAGLGMFLMSLAAIAASGISTYDIAFAMAPREMAFYVAAATVAVIDGGFLFLDWFFPYQKTQTARTLVALFMAALWVMMVVTNITDAVWRNSADVGSWVIYGVKVMGLIWLAVYTWIRFDDPDTKRILNNTRIQEIHDNELLLREQEFAERIAPAEARAMAIVNLERKFKAAHGRNIDDVLGRDWATELLKVERPVEAGNDADQPKGKAKPVVPTAPRVEVQPFGEYLKGKWNAIVNPTSPQGQK